VPAVDIGRLYTKTNSPLFSHFEETLHGGTAIRAGAFGRTLVREHHLLALANIKTEFYQTIAVRWLDLRVSMSATLTSFFTTLLLCVAIATDWPGVSKTMVGFVIVTVFDCTDALGWAIMCVSNVERAMSRIERVFQFSSITPEERAVYLDVPRGEPTMAAKLLRSAPLREAAGAAHGGLSMAKPTSEKDLSLEDGGGKAAGVVGLSASSLRAARSRTRSTRPPTGRRRASSSFATCRCATATTRRSRSTTSRSRFRPARRSASSAAPAPARRASRRRSSA
jgi:hypothetical protein